MWDNPDDRMWASFLLICIVFIIAIGFYWLADTASQIVAAVEQAAGTVVP